MFITVRKLFKVQLNLYTYMLILFLHIQIQNYILNNNFHNKNYDLSIAFNLQLLPTFTKRKTNEKCNQTSQYY